MKQTLYQFDYVANVKLWENQNQSKLKTNLVLHSVDLPFPGMSVTSHAELREDWAEGGRQLTFQAAITFTYCVRIEIR